ncbi:hypothetical protein GCM10017788_80120 [Amycolatopsis acidiphila]|nr:hypothetical protein GCM10017788_80120 [Amycolatopsis acidiphila]
MTGLVVQGTGWEILVRGDRASTRRDLTGSDVVILDGVTGRYVWAAPPTAPHCGQSARQYEHDVI